MQCLLCPHNCVIAKGRSGLCGVRINTGDKIVLNTYGILSGYAVDPVEKKPLYHFFPGSKILSVGSFGCNMKCDFCQNYQISQYFPEHSGRMVTPDKLVAEAIRLPGNVGIAFTYNEPVISFEFMRDTCTIAKEAGLYTVMVSNGYVNPGPLKEILGFIDAFNIDLKAFNTKFYRQVCGASPDPVRNTLIQITEAGKHLEITTLVIPGQNDGEDEMRAQSDWISNKLGRGVPFHLSRYFPMNRRNDPQTTLESLEKLSAIASEYLDYVYVGNLDSGNRQNTICPVCGLTVTTRSGYHIRTQDLDKDGKCKGCGTTIYRYFRLSRR